MRFLISFGLLALLSFPSTADYGGSRGTYLKFELEKVSIVSIEFHGLGTPLRSKVLRVSGLPARLQSDRTSRLSSGQAGPLTATLTGKRQHRPVQVLKPVDKATPLIQKAITRNQVLPRVVLRGRHTTTGGTVLIILLNARITSQSQQSRSSTGTVQTEMIALDLRG